MLITVEVFTIQVGIIANVSVQVEVSLLYYKRRYIFFKWR